MDSPVAAGASEPSMSSGSDEYNDDLVDTPTSPVTMVQLATQPAQPPAAGLHVVDYDMDDLTRGPWARFIMRMRYALGYNVVHCAVYDDDAASVWGDVSFFPAFFVVDAGGRVYAYRGERTLAALVQAYKDVTA